MQFRRYQLQFVGYYTWVGYYAWVGYYTFVGYYTWAALPLLVISMFFTHVVILLKICYVISDKEKYISLAVLVTVYS